jgi:hypothetical protein
MALHGWVVADLFVTGLRAAGEDFTRASLVDAINEMTDYDAGGIIRPVDWTTAHEADTDEACTAFLQVEGGKLVPKFGEPGKPFVCFPTDTEALPEPLRR